MKSLPLHEPFLVESDEKAVMEVLRSSWISNRGPAVERFEQEFARRVGSKHAIALSSGTAALQLMIEMAATRAGFHSGFDVIVPTLTFIATANAVTLAGGEVCLVDCEPNAINVSAQTLEHFISRRYTFHKDEKKWFSLRTKRPLLGFLATHLMGWSTDMGSLVDFCRQSHVTLFEDAAEAVGCLSPDGRHLGTFGLAGGFSFNANKIITTGSGGMLVTNDDKFHRQALHHSTTAKTDALRFIHDSVGCNIRMAALLAALGSSQLARLDEILSKKKKNFQSYGELLAKNGPVLHEEKGIGQSNHWINNLVFNHREERERAIEKLAQAKVESRPLWTPVHMQPAYHSKLEIGTRFPHAERFHSVMLSIPSSVSLTREEIERVVEIVHSSQVKEKTRGRA